MEQRGHIVQLFFQINTAGPVEYSVEMTGLTPRFGRQYLRKLSDKIFSPGDSSVFSWEVFKGSELEYWLKQKKKAKVQ